MSNTTSTIEIRRADERGLAELGWLHSRHSFSFGRYYDPEKTSYRSLRVLNDDIVEGGTGFPEHPHENLEIITWVLEGALEHKDSTGEHGVIKPGDAQVMTAGSGIRHSEFNASKTDPVHLLQIWIETSEQNVEPSYTQKTMPKSGRHNQWQVLVSPDGRDDSQTIRQDAIMSVADLGAGNSLEVELKDDRYGYLHLATGKVRVNGEELGSGDALVLSGETKFEIESIEDSQVLWFDLS